MNLDDWIREKNIYFIKIIVVIVLISVLLAILGNVDSVEVITPEVLSDRAYLRTVELQIADFEARLEVFESLDIAIHVIGHNGADVMRTEVSELVDVNAKPKGEK